MTFSVFFMPSSAGKPPRAHIQDGVFTKLGAGDGPAFAAHLLRLSPEDRHRRFGYARSDTSLVDYAHKTLRAGHVLHAYRHDGQIRAVAELCALSADESVGEKAAEAAFSVEEAYRHQGIGEALMRRIHRSACNRGVRTIRVHCDRDNGPMRALARRNALAVSADFDGFHAEIPTDGPRFSSFIAEMAADSHAFGLSVLADQVAALRRLAPKRTPSRAA